MVVAHEHVQANLTISLWSSWQDLYILTLLRRSELEQETTEGFQMRTKGGLRQLRM